MRANDCKPLAIKAASPPSLQVDENTPASSLVPCASLTPEEVVLNRVSVTPGQAIAIEAKTRSWYEERQLRITASFFGRVCKRRPSTSPFSLVNSIINQRAYQLIPLSCAWGKDNEDKAVSAYLQLMQEKGHSGVIVAPSGLVINPEYAWLGASPDGLVTNPHSPDPNGLLEIKCPYKFRDCTPLEAASQQGFCCQLENSTVVLKKQHDSYFQVQGQMAICSKQWCDFVIYTSVGISIQRIPFDPTVWTTMLVKLREFYFTSLVPKLAEKL